MPINIYRLDAKRTKLAWLCDDEWRLPEQISALERWIARKRKKEAVECVADVGFQSRKDAGGGGSALSSSTLKRLGDYNVTLHLSEYPGYAEKKRTEMKTEPNKAMEPTPVAVTIPAYAGLAPSTSAAHL